MCNVRVWKEQLPGSFSQMLEKIPVRVTWKVVYGPVFGKMAWEAATLDLHTLPTTLGWTSSEGRSTQRTLLTGPWYLNTTFPYCFPFDFGLPILLLEFLSLRLAKQIKKQQLISSCRASTMIYTRHCWVWRSSIGENKYDPWIQYRGKKLLLSSN